jgi:hypothetical protein
MMNLTTRLRQLEEVAVAADAGRYPAGGMSEDRLAQALKPNFEWLGIVFPSRPWSDEDRRAIDAFWDGSFGLGPGSSDGRKPWFTVYGYSVFQFQVSLRNLAEECGLALSEFHPTGGKSSWSIDQADLGPYRWNAGMDYRQRMQKKYGRDCHLATMKQAQAVASEVRRGIDLTDQGRKADNVDVES